MCRQTGCRTEVTLLCITRQKEDNNDVFITVNSKYGCFSPGREVHQSNPRSTLMPFPLTFDLRVGVKGNERRKVHLFHLRKKKGLRGGGMLTHRQPKGLSVDACGLGNVRPHNMGKLTKS